MTTLRRLGLVTLGLYLVLAAALCVSHLISALPAAAGHVRAACADGAGGGLWSILSWTPPCIPTDGAGAPRASEANAFAVELSLLAVVLAAGALGAVIHATRSFAWYLGNDKFKWNWTAFYLLMPVVGAGMGLIGYLVFRGGFIAADGAESANPFGFAAMAVVAGLFAEQVIVKLKKLVERLFAPAPRGKNDASPDRPRGD